MNREPYAGSGAGGDSGAPAATLARCHRAGLGRQCPIRNIASPSSGKKPGLSLPKAGRNNGPHHEETGKCNDSQKRFKRQRQTSKAPPGKRRGSYCHRHTSEPPPDSTPSLAGRPGLRLQVDNLDLVVNHFQVQVHAFDELQDRPQLCIQPARIIGHARHANARAARDRVVIQVGHGGVEGVADSPLQRLHRPPPILQ